MLNYLQSICDASVLLTTQPATKNSLHHASRTYSTMLMPPSMQKVHDGSLNSQHCFDGALCRHADNQATSKRLNRAHDSLHAAEADSMDPRAYYPLLDKQGGALQLLVPFATSTV